MRSDEPRRPRPLLFSLASLVLCAGPGSSGCAGPASTRNGLNLTIVSAANSKFVAPQLAQLVQLREKMEAECMLTRARVITFDLGLHDCERDALRRILPMLGPQFELRAFEVPGARPAPRRARTFTPLFCIATRSPCVCVCV